MQADSAFMWLCTEPTEQLHSCSNTLVQSHLCLQSHLC
jgi:hypothetical protein